VLAARMRRASPRVLGRVADDGLILDLRTVPPQRDVELCSAISAALL
jgi:hypothetical protein